MFITRHIILKLLVVIGFFAAVFPLLRKELNGSILHTAKTSPAADGKHPLGVDKDGFSRVFMACSYIAVCSVTPEISCVALRLFINLILETSC